MKKRELVKRIWALILAMGIAVPFGGGSAQSIFAEEDAGAVIIGEPSSGGSCCIQVGTDAEGLSYVMSSGQWQLVDPQGRNVENGCVVDLPIEPVSSDMVDSLLSLLGADEGLPSFEHYFDEAMLDEMMNDYFQEEEEDAA